MPHDTFLDIIPVPSLQLQTPAKMLSAPALSNPLEPEPSLSGFVQMLREIAKMAPKIAPKWPPKWASLNPKMAPKIAKTLVQTVANDSTLFGEGRISSFSAL